MKPTNEIIAAWPRERALQIREILEGFNLCGCGSNSEHEIIRMVLNRIVRQESCYEDADDADGRWVEFVAKILDAWGLTEHGTGIGYGWLTDKGKLLLGFYGAFGDGPDEWPAWVKEFSWTLEPLTGKHKDWYELWTEGVPSPL